MKITEKKIDALNIELTLAIGAADYEENERKRLAECRRKADFKGFRRGMVPASMIKRVYGDQCLAEAVNDVISTQLDKYINDNNLHVLGEPLSSEKQPEIEWVDGNDFTFIFDIALSPEVKVEAVKEDEVPSYNVTIAAKDKASMEENLKKYYSENKTEKSEEEIKKEVDDRMSEQYRNEAEWRLSKDIRDYFVNKAGITLPEDFLKRFLVATNNGKVSKEDVEKEFEGFAQDFKWQLVRGSFMKQFGFKIEEKDIREAAQAYVSYQYAMYGMSNVPEDLVKEAVVNMLQDQKQVERLVEQVEEKMVVGRIKEIITLKPTKITSAKFRELK